MASDAVFSSPLAPDRTLVFTDLDGTLLDHETYSFEAARTTLERLEELSVPVVFNTAPAASDCNGDGVPDACNIAADGSLDQNSNGILDECEALLFLRGDCNADGNVDLADAACVLNWLFAGGAAPFCVKAADANDTGTINLTDSVYLLNFLFSGGPAPAAPFAECGADPTPDELRCDRFGLCV